jgi:hypothetical protein
MAETLGFYRGDAKSQNIRTLRAALNTLGDGFVEAIDDNTLVTIAAQQVRATHGKIHGEVESAEGEYV